MQNAYIERKNGSIRREFLYAYLFNSLAEVRILSEEWREITQRGVIEAREKEARYKIFLVQDVVIISKDPRNATLVVINESKSPSSKNSS